MKKSKILVLVAIAFVAGMFFLTGGATVKADIPKDTLIQEGVYIGGINVGGMTADEATAAVEAYVAKVEEQWIVLSGPKNVLRYQWSDLGFSAKTSEAVQKAVSIGNTGNMIKRFMELQNLEKENYVVDMGLSIDKQLTGNKIHGKRSKIDIKAIDNGVKRVNGKFVYYEGQDGDEVDIVPSVNKLNEWLGTDWEISIVENKTFELDSVTSHPRGTKEELALIKDVLGSFATNYRATSPPGRAQNVETGTKKLNGIILYPGDEFSFYEYVTPFTAENGYAEGGSYEDGNVVQSFGGGICQVVTTLYNAVLEAELQITQRFAHSMTVGYVPLSADAAIAGTYKDLRFKNNYDFPVYIEALLVDGDTVFNIYGAEKRPSNRVITFESEIISENDPETEFTLSSAEAVGSFIQTRSKHVGYVAKYWKIITIDGVESERVQLNKSTYKSSCRKVTIGTAGATAEQLAKIKEALKTKDDEHIQSVVEGLINPPEPEQPETPDTETTTPENGEETNSEAGDNSNE